MKKWFVGLMVLLGLVLASSASMAVADYRVCSNCWEYRNGTTEYITDPNEIETSWDMHTDRIFTCSVCSVKTKLWSLHTGGGATCTTEGTCDFCHAAYKDSSVHTGPYTYSYSKTSDTRHNVKPTCTGCRRVARTYSAKHEETEAATCKTVAYCGLCRSRYGEKDPDNHVGKAYAIDAKKISETQHTPKLWYECCGYMFDGDPTEHTIRDEATCKTAAYCGLCRSRYGEKDPGNHVGTPTTTHVKTSEIQHTAKITYADCGHTVDGASTYHTETTPATCTAAAYCADCKSSYGEADPDAHALESHDAQAPTCFHVGWDAYETCSRCDYTTYAEKSALDHDYVTHDAQAASCTEVGWDAYETCSRCDYSTYAEKPALGHDIVKHDAKAASCTEIGWDAYETCSRCDYSTYAEKPALGHDYAAKTTKPTCTKKGYTTHTCTRCQDSYRDEIVSALGHWYGEWTPNADGTNSASCLRDAYEHTVDCVRFSFVLTAEDVRTEFVLCPVCGEVSEIRLIDENGEVVETREAVRLLLVEDAKAEALTECLPEGELVVRMGALESGDVLMSVAFEIGGEPTQPTGQVKITLPAGLLEGYALCLLSEDGTEAELTLDVQEDTVSFVIDYTDSLDTVKVLHLVPAV